MLQCNFGQKELQRPQTFGSGMRQKAKEHVKNLIQTHADECPHAFAFGNVV